MVNKWRETKFRLCNQKTDSKDIPVISYSVTIESVD